MFNLSEQTLPDFLEDLHQTAERAFGEHAQSMIENLLYAKMPPSLKKSINQAYLENGTYDQIIKHIEREMELNGIEQSDDLPVTTMTATSKQPPRRTQRSLRIQQQRKSDVIIARKTDIYVKNATN